MINIGIISFRGIRETSEKFCSLIFILLENWGEAMRKNNRGDRGHSGTAGGEVENKSWIARKSAGVSPAK